MRFLVIHPLEPGTTRERLIEIARSAPPEIKEYRSFVNLTECKAVCLFDAVDQEHLVKWMEEQKLPFETIWPVEVECQHEEFIELPTEVGVA